MSLAQPWLLVIVGSALGGGARFWLTTAVARPLGTAFPWGTLAVNLLGCMTVGILAALHAREPLEMNGDIKWVLRLADQPQWAGKMTVDGNLDRLAAKGHLEHPFAATIVGALSDLRTAWHWDGDVGIPEFTLKPWSPSSKVAVRDITVATSATRDGFSVIGQMQPTMPATGPLDVSFLGNYADRTLHAEQLRLAQSRGKTVIQASGDARFGDGPMQLDFKGRWRDFGWPLDAKPAASSTRGEFTFAGTLPYRYTASGDLKVPQVPPLDFSAAGIRCRREAGLADARRIIRRAPWESPVDPVEGVIVHELSARTGG